jgi:hypothetical protein
MNYHVRRRSDSSSADELSCIRCRKFSAAESEQPGIESDQWSLQALAGRLGCNVTNPN